MNSNPNEKELELAALVHLPFVFIIFLLFKELRKSYFLRYNIFHALLITIGFIFLFSLLIIISSIYPEKQPSLIMIIYGIIFSFLLIGGIIYSFYCSFLAYSGKYIIVPVITKLYYYIFERHKEEKIINFSSSKKIVKQPRRIIHKNIKKDI